MAATATAHFTPDLFRFLRELERNNNRPWFETNRQRYLDHVRDPMLRFIGDVAPRMGRISRRIVADPAPFGGSMIRVYRDMRFARDGAPYKTAASAQFHHEYGRTAYAPGFYLQLATDAVRAGSGLWHPDPITLSRVRDHLVANPTAWKRVVGAAPFRDGTLRLGGASLKRPPRGHDPDHPLAEDIKRKDYVTITEFDESAACAPDFLDRYVALCRSAASFTRFLARALDLPW